MRLFTTNIKECPVLNSGHPTSWRKSLRDNEREVREERGEPEHCWCPEPRGRAHRLRVEGTHRQQGQGQKAKDAEDQGDCSVSLGWALSHLGGSSFTADENGLR